MIDLPSIGFGGAPIGGLFEPVDDAQAEATLEAAWDGGIRYFDTAPLYGLGASERRIGAFLKGKDGYLLSTKVGRLLRPGEHPPTEWDDFDWDFSYDGVMRSVEESLERLDLDRVDMLFIHDPDDHHDEALAGAFKALELLRFEGTISALGAGMNQVQMLTRFAQESDFDCFLVAGRYTLLDQSASVELFPVCEERGIQIIAGGVFNSGLLAGGSTYDYTPAPAELVERARRLANVCFRHGVSLKAAALQFPYRHPVVSCVLTGARTPSEITENIEAFEMDLPDALWTDLGTLSS